MAFWGVEVKPGRPYTYKHDDVKGRLHISMATLGFGASTAKSTLQCNVGSRSPVYICSLYPATTESLQLNLEFEEVDQVVFSVIGPRSFHLCGYYVASACNANIIDHSESYGEDIADTETERSDNSDEDDYEDSFIDDDAVPEVFLASPISDEEEASYDTRTKGRKGSLRRLRKKYRPVESDDDNCEEDKMIADDNEHDQSDEIKNDDSLPISCLFKKNKACSRTLDQEMNDNVDGGTGGGGNKCVEKDENSINKTNIKAENDVPVDSQMHRETELSNNLVDPCIVPEVGDIKKLKKKRNGKEKEIKSSCNDHSIKLDNGVGDGLSMEKVMPDFVAGNEQHQPHGDDKETEAMDKKILASSPVINGQNEKPKKRRKGRSEEGSLVNPPQRNEHNTQQHTVNGDVNISDKSALPSAEMDPEKRRTKRIKKEQVKKGTDVFNEDIIEEDKANRDAAESHNLIHPCLEEKEQNQRLSNEKSVDGGDHDFPVSNQSEDRKLKKKKKKSKNQDNVVVNSDIPVFVTMEEDKKKWDDSNPSQVGTLSDGLVVQELEKGAKDGKIAASGKKISIFYTGKLKDNGVIVDSNAGEAPFKFRLGKGQVIKGWDVGIEGMRVGEKRRLVIPPSMTSKSDGQSAEEPPNSWLIYDIELVKVH